MRRTQLRSLGPPQPHHHPWLHFPALLRRIRLHPDSWVPGRRSSPIACLYRPQGRRATRRLSHHRRGMLHRQARQAMARHHCRRLDRFRPRLRPPEDTTRHRRPATRPCQADTHRRRRPLVHRQAGTAQRHPPAILLRRVPILLRRVPTLLRRVPILLRRVPTLLRRVVPTLLRRVVPTPLRRVVPTPLRRVVPTLLRRVVPTLLRRAPTRLLAQATHRHRHIQCSRRCSR